MEQTNPKTSNAKTSPKTSEVSAQERVETALANPKSTQSTGTSGAKTSPKTSSPKTSAKTSPSASVSTSPKVSEKAPVSSSKTSPKTSAKTSTKVSNTVLDDSNELATLAEAPKDYADDVFGDELNCQHGQEDEAGVEIELLTQDETIQRLIVAAYESIEDAQAILVTAEILLNKK